MKRTLPISALLCLLLAHCSTPADPPHDAATATDARAPTDAPVARDDATSHPTDDASEPADVVVSNPDVTAVGPGDVLPAFDAATQAHVRELVARGRARGNRHEVFAKVGDSITESNAFLSDCGSGWYRLGTHTGLEPTILYFSATVLADSRNSFNRQSLCATAGWTAESALENAPNSPLDQELGAIHPQWAIVMYGTNDLERVDAATYVANLTRVVDATEARDVVTVLSTIPPRGDGEPYATRATEFSNLIRGLAAARHLPLIDYNAALGALPDHGLGPDGVHPETYRDPADPSTDTCTFTDDALRFGYNVRNLLAIEMLARLQQY